MHLDKFNHNCSWDLRVDASNLNRICSQNLDFFLVLDLEGKVEILEFPVLMIDAKTMEVVDFFHRFTLFSSYCTSQCKFFSLVFIAEFCVLFS